MGQMSFYKQAPTFWKNLLFYELNLIIVSTSHYSIPCSNRFVIDLNLRLIPRKKTKKQIDVKKALECSMLTVANYEHTKRYLYTIIEQGET